MGVGGQRHAPAALTPGKTRYTLYTRLGGQQGRSGRVRKFSPPTGVQSPDIPARRESAIPTELTRLWNGMRGAKKWGSKRAIAEGRHSYLLKRTKVTFTAWVESLNPGNADQDGGGRVAPVKNTRLSLLVVSCSICDKPTVKQLATKNNTEYNCIISHAQNTTALQFNVFLNSNISVTGHKPGTGGFPQHMRLSRSYGNFSVGMFKCNHSTLYTCKHRDIRLNSRQEIY